MTINHSYVQVPNQTVKSDTVVMTIGANIVSRQIVALGDPENGLIQSFTGTSANVNVTNTVDVNVSSMPLPTGAATLTEQQAQTTSLGTDGASPPSIAGTGVRGWLRGIYEQAVLLVSGLTSGTQRTKITDGTNNNTILQIGTQVTSSNYGIVTNSVMHGLSTAGGGSYVDVKVTPSGSLAVDTGLDQPLTDAQLRASAVPVSQSGIWNINNISGAISLPTGAATSALQTIGNTSLGNIDTKFPNQLSSAIPVSARDYRQDVARGLVANESVVVIKGYNGATSTTNELVWAQSGATYPQVTSAVTLTISSSNANDTLAGTGAQIVLVKYVRFSDLVEVTALFNMNGRTAVTISADGYAINEIRVVQVGSTNSNVGVVYVGYGTVTAGVPANILGTIAATTNVGQQAVYTVPASKTLELVSYRISPSVLSVVQFRVKPLKSSAMLTVEYDIPLNQVAAFESPYPSLIPAGYQIQIWARANAGAGQLGLIIQGDLRG